MTTPNGQQQMRLTAEQYATTLIVEALLANMQTALNQLGGFVKYEPGAQAIAHAQQVLNDDYVRLREAWVKTVVIAPAAALSVIEGKAH